MHSHLRIDDNIASLTLQLFAGFRCIVNPLTRRRQLHICSRLTCRAVNTTNSKARYRLFPFQIRERIRSTGTGPGKVRSTGSRKQVKMRISSNDLYHYANYLIYGKNASDRTTHKTTRKRGTLCDCVYL